MLTHHQIAAATRIGMLTRERDTASACAQALCELSDALPLDAAALLAIDPLTGVHTQLAGIGYTAETSQSMAAEFVTTPWYGSAVRQELPPSICEDDENAGPRFRHGWFYAERVRPAGFRDGVTGGLRRGARVVGLVHLATQSADVYHTEARRLLASVIPALAVLADPLAHTGDQHGLADEGAAALVTPEGGVVDLPGRDRPRVLRDEEFHGVLRTFAGTDGLRLRMLWPVDGAWYRVSLHRHRASLCAAKRVVLVHETSVEPPYGLSRRELEVLTRAATGQTNRAIAQTLFLSPRTVHSHIEHLLRKTGCASRAEATALAVRDGLLRPAADDLLFFVER
ncbi:response regulator transcription factor [Streptomyces sp. 4F14]|uniref:helix-turn-helix transcriptional regulator n=1 Tax=Streptomyces sp. 4F14 TaxID=3394380 RepID=UPI003A84178F